MRPVVALLAAYCLHAQSVLTPDLESLSKIRTRMLFNLQHQPNYTCVETIERSSRAKTSGKLKIVDTLRLEVGLVDGKEMFAWPGSKKFEDFDLTTMVTSGAIGNGNFGTHAKALFGSRSATFHYRGEVDFQRKRVIKFDYEVPQMLSGYRIRVASASAIVGYHGSVYVDPQTLDMERIQVIADDIPLDLMLSSAEDDIDYAIAHIGDGNFLLPSQSELSMVDLSGGENHNHVRFTACRQFSGESVLTFGDAPSGAAVEAASVPARAFDLPKGLELTLVLNDKIELKTAATGDPVTARIDRDVKLKGQLLIPKGATAKGRITRLEKYETYSILGMEFPEIEAPGILAKLKGTLDHIAGIAPVSSRRIFKMRLPLQPGEGVFEMNASQLTIARGCIIFWRT